jgi:hypothetical protein
MNFVQSGGVGWGGGGGGEHHSTFIMIRLAIQRLLARPQSTQSTITADLSEKLATIRVHEQPKLVGHRQHYPDAKPSWGETNGQN